MGMLERLRARWQFLVRQSAPGAAAFDYAPVASYIQAVTGAAVYDARPSREAALRVPAVLRGRNLICSISTLPLIQRDADFNVSRSPFLEQIDPNVPNLVTLAMTLEDLLLESISWWRITKRMADGFPLNGQHLNCGQVSLTPPKGSIRSLPSHIDPASVVWVDGKPVNGRDMIRFDSPNPGILDAARRSIRRAVKLEEAAERYADDPRALAFFTPDNDADPPDDADIPEILEEWEAARRERATAYVPGGLKYNTVDWMSPADLQLAELQKRAALDIANAVGLDPEDLGISTTSRTYQNAVDRRKDRINDVLAVYMLAITGRLSMNDVTKRGYQVAFDLTDYLKADPMTLANVEEKHLAMGTITREEIRREQSRPPMVGPAAPTAPEAPATDQQQTEAGMGEVRPLRRATFGAAAPAAATDRRVTFTVPAGRAEFRVDLEARTITGLAVPFGEVTSDWRRIVFAPGSIEASDVTEPVFMDHMGVPVGRVQNVSEDPEVGQFAELRISRTQAGDEALVLADDRAITGLSVGVDIHRYEIDEEADTITVTSATRREISLTPFPAFQSARIDEVRLNQQRGTTQMEPCTTCGQVHAAGTACPTAPAAPAPTPPETGGQPVQQPPAAPAAPAAAPPAQQHQAGSPDDFRAMAAAFMAEAFARQAAAATGQAVASHVNGGTGPEPVNPRQPGTAPLSTATLSVREPVAYRFDRGGNFTADPHRGDHIFTADLLAMARANDTEGRNTDAGRRVMGLIQEQFADVSTDDVDELNPVINQPSRYVDQQDYRRTPLWDLVNKGGLPNGVQPFSFPKFASASGLVGDHTQAAEPASGTFVTTAQTITPTAVSGKASLTREVWDMGGNPQTSTLVWRQMVRSWREALEAATATFLGTLTAATDINLGVAIVDGALAAAWDTALAQLQFVRGYDFSAFAVEQFLFLAFVNAKDTTGRKLFPIINPTNANGTAVTRFRTLDLSGVEAVPAWALPGTTGLPNNSWLFDPMFVHGWATPPQRLEFPGTSGTAYAPVAMVDIGLWGYKAFANSDIAAVRQVIYDNT
jgi:HK97 family phage prohead protease